MRKETTICFRSSEELRSALETLARGDRRTLSSVIELILTDYVRANSKLAEPARQEKRKFPRKPTTVPAYVRNCMGDVANHGAVILDMSLGGLRVSVPKEWGTQLTSETAKGRQFEASFALPERSTPVRVVCEPERVVPSVGHLHVGARIVDADFEDYQLLQRHLM
jgi:hypothetical protein